jgi:glycosyltransferase involved in cell wall biosynthesis
MSDERRRVLQMGPDPATGGGMPSALKALLASPLSEHYRLEVVPTYRSPRPLPRLGTYCLALLRLAVWSLGRRGRVVHVHATVRGSAYRKAVCVLVAWALRRHVVLQVHSGAGDIAAFRSGRGRLSVALFAAAFAVADAVLAVSAASAEALKRAGVAGTIEVVPNAAPRVTEFKRCASPEEEVRVVYLGGFANSAKGGDVLSAALLRFRDPRFQVTLAGAGEPPAETADLVARAAWLDWVGWLEPDAKEKLLHNSHVFVLPSRSEGLPMALLEAMASGAAVLATEIGGIPEVVDDEVNGLLVPPEQPEALGDALRRLVEDPVLRERLGRAAQERVRRLDAVEVADRLARLYARFD